MALEWGPRPPARSHSGWTAGAAVLVGWGGEVQAERPLPRWSAAPGAKEGAGNSPSHIGFGLDRGGRERRLLPLESVLKVLVIVCVVPGRMALSDPLLPDPVIQRRWTIEK